MADEGSAILDVEDLGRRLRAARLMKGWSGDRVVEELASRGVVTTKRTLHAYERGDWMMPLDMFFAVTAVLAPDTGIRHFAAALTPEWRARWVEAFGDGL
jgi:transcriptional regulator with XRE-family HTH domain